MARTLRALAVASAVALATVHPALGNEYQRLENMHHTAWTAKDGLLGRADTLAQTADGYLWIGTSNGLYRFDGVEFERFSPPGSTLAAVAVDALLASRDGGLWVGFAAGGATYIGPGGEIRNYGHEHGLPVGVVRAFAEDHDGVIWVAATGGLARLEDGRWRPVRMEMNYPCRSANRFFLARDGTLWVAGSSPNRVLYLPKGSGQFQDLGLTSTMFGVVQLEDGTIVISEGATGVVRELNRRDDGTYSHQIVEGLRDHPRAVDRDGGVWLLGQGANRVRMTSSPASAGGVAPEAIERLPASAGLSGRVSNDLLVDREGSIWSVSDTGLDRFRRRNLTWKRDSRVDGAASIVSDSKGVAWVISPRHDRLWRADDASPGPTVPYETDRGFLEREGSVWLSANGSFLRWADQRIERVSPPDELVARGYNFRVLAADMDRQGRLWASINGLGQFYLQHGKWTFVPVLDGRADWTAVKVHVDDADRVWLAYVTEVARVAHGQVREFSGADGLDIGPVLAIKSRGPTVWFGGERGLAFEKNDRFHTVHLVDDREVGAVYEVVPTAASLWLNAAVGIVQIPEAEIVRLAEDAAYRVRYQLFDRVSDLPEPLLSHRRFVPAAEGREGVLWFLTDNGIASLNPAHVVRNAVPPPVRIRALTVDDEAYDLNASVLLPPLSRTIRIDYTALSLAIPERVRFRYQLEGWETGWHDVGPRRTATYTDLNPGRYAFRVLASNNDGVWNETGATLSFTVAPAWYQTLWFSGLVSAGLAAAVVATYRRRVRNVSAALSARFDERLAERTRIARELHDTLLQTVQGSKMIADDALDRPGDAEHMSHALTRLSEWLGRAVQEGRGALHSLRDSTVQVNDLAEALRRIADDPTKPDEMTVALTVHGESRDLHPIVRDEIYRIAYEAIRNAYAHSNASSLEIELTYARDLKLRVADNGDGIEPAVAVTGRTGRFGVPGMRERAADIGGELIIESAAGTSIRLTVPGRNAYRGRPVA